MIAPCPICGGVTQSDGELGVWFVGCTDNSCALSGPIRSSEAEAIAAWNAVAEKVARHDRLVAALRELRKYVLSWTPNVLVTKSPLREHGLVRMADEALKGTE